MLFVKSEMQYRLESAGMQGQRVDVVAGITAGVVQGAMVAPTQRVKLIVATNVDAGAVSFNLVRQTVAMEGIGTLFRARGTGVMCARRGIDWGLRFYGSRLAKDFFVGRKAAGEDKSLTFYESFAAGLFGGAFSALILTTP